MLGGFSSVLCAVLSVGVSVRSFCSCIACVISLSSLKLFSVSFVCSLFSFPFVLKRPFLGSYKN
ncbi:putative membrane protein [Helicobacter pylori NQ4076]|uniref:Putative membrane protein n=1 Tax=Helicobacter pylori NQ4076 TaxID=992029 RepID=I9QCT0_HELPX|nr:putative membrane protein [Helicobacter pylori NQ4076]